MYSGEAAEQLADKYKCEKVERSYFDTQKRFDDWYQLVKDIIILFKIKML